MDESLYDEFGNYIGPALDESEVRARPEAEAVRLWGGWGKEGRSHRTPKGCACIVRCINTLHMPPLAIV